MMTVSSADDWQLLRFNFLVAPFRALGCKNGHAPAHGQYSDISGGTMNIKRQFATSTGNPCRGFRSLQVVVDIICMISVATLDDGGTRLAPPAQHMFG
jgi:hypothetical protein